MLPNGKVEALDPQGSIGGLRLLDCKEEFARGLLDMLFRGRSGEFPHDLLRLADAELIAEPKERFGVRGARQTNPHRRQDAPRT